MASSRPCNIGFLGCGPLNTEQHIQNAANSRLCVVHTLCDVDAERLQQAVRAFNPRKATRDAASMFADPEVDLVVIATRPEYHAQLAIDALQAGKNVYCEKPLGVTSAEARAVAAAAAKVGRHVAVGYNRRYAPSMQDAQKCIQGRSTGLLLNYRLVDHERGGRENHPRLAEEVCHIYDLCAWLCDADPVSVMATVGTHPNDNAILLSFVDGSQATILSSGRGTNAHPKERLEAFWEHHAVFVEDFIRAEFFNIPGIDPVRYYPGRRNDRTPADLVDSLGRSEGLSAMDATRRRFADTWDAKYRGQPYDQVLAEMPVNYCMDKGWAHALEEMAAATMEKRCPGTADPAAGIRANVVAHAVARSIETHAPATIDASEWQ